MNRPGKTMLAGLLLVALALPLVSSCAPSAIVFAGSDKEASTNTGQEFMVALESNPTTGYSWTETHDSTFLVLYSDEYKPGTNKGDTVGAGGTHYFRFRALKPGTTEITFTYKRPWETEVFEVSTFIINID